MNGNSSSGCVFCQIVAGTSPARWVRNEPDSNLVVFHNRLKWADVMLLVIPRVHMTQRELWSSGTLSECGRLGIEVGDELCRGEFRVLSNFGRWAHQSQEHAHLHVISGVANNLAHARPDGAKSVVNGVSVEPFKVDRTPSAIRFAGLGADTQRELWTGSELQQVAGAALTHADERSHSGFRLASNFTGPDGGDPGLFLLGGGQLDLYI